MILYPFKFKPVFQNRIWGGNKLKTILNKEYDEIDKCGESWEISNVKGGVSVVKNGALQGKFMQELIDHCRENLLGKKVIEKYGKIFPMLIKFIDAQDDLSVQVHPNDEIALKKHNCFGKSEMWYVLEADEGATLFCGFKENVTKEDYIKHLKANTLEEILNKESVKSGDVFYLPAGRVHSIGKGILLAEIQQSSDITYRIYDYNRKDDNGNLRELHTENALDALDFTFHKEYKTLYKKIKNEPITLVKTEYFTTRLICCDENYKSEIKILQSFVIYICLKGSFLIEYPFGAVKIQKGETVLIPSMITDITLIPLSDFEVLEVFIE